jgi:hypothetical protein
MGRGGKKRKTQGMQQSPQGGALRRSTLDQSRVRALTNRLTLQVPAVVWEHVIAQDSIAQRRAHGVRVRSAVMIQRCFRRWKREHWTRSFKQTDKVCERLAAEALNRENSGGFFAKAKETAAIKALQRGPDLSLVASPDILAHDPVRALETRLYLLALNNDATVLDHQRQRFRHTCAARHASRTADDTAIREEQRSCRALRVLDEEQGTREIVSYFSVLRHSNRSLFSQVPAELLRETRNGTQNRIRDRSSSGGSDGSSGGSSSSNNSGSDNTSSGSNNKTITSYTSASTVRDLFTGVSRPKTASSKRPVSAAGDAISGAARAAASGASTSRYIARPERLGRPHHDAQLARPRSAAVLVALPKPTAGKPAAPRHELASQRPQSQ